MMHETRSIRAERLRSSTQTAGALRRYLLPTLALWAIILGPVLCVAGVLEHLCADCPPAESCQHEDGCASDPCVDVAARTTTAPDSGIPTSLSCLVASPFFAEVEMDEVPSIPLEPFPRGRKNLPRPESDLPLLN